MFKDILIVGSGTMGQGVASLLLSKMLNVTVIVRNDSSIESVRNSIKKSVSRLARRAEAVIDIEAAFSRLNVIVTPDSDSKFDLVFEAVVEDLNTKKSLIENFQEYVNPNTIWATNTSSLSVTDMAMVYPYPENLLGLHFFNPVSNMELVEVIPSMLTSEETIQRCWFFSSQIGKHPVRVEDSPGFIVNRLLIPMINEAVGILESRVATAEEIDTAMKLGAHHPLGPLALADLIGNDVCLSIMKALYSSTCDSKYRPSYLLQKMVSANKLGRKSGQGFYSY